MTGSRVDILDGPMGTALGEAGVPVGGPAWSARALFEHPEAVAAIHRSYAAAGATVHTANTFRATPAVLGSTFRTSVLRAVELARGAVPQGQRIAGSVASMVDCYRPGDLVEDPRDHHRRTAEALAQAGCDLLLCETFAGPAEALIASEEATRTGLPVWLALTAGPEGTLVSPETLATTASASFERGVERVLVNCISGRRIAPYVEALAKLGKPFGVYANAGNPADRLGYLTDWGLPAPSERERAARVAAYVDLARGWVASGATVVGGCCGTSAAHIAGLAQAFSL